MSSKLLEGIREPYESYYPSDSDVKILRNFWKETYWKDFIPLETGTVLKKVAESMRLSRSARKYFDWTILMFDYSANFIIDEFKLFEKLKYVLKLDPLTINKCEFALYMLMLAESGRVKSWDKVRELFPDEFPKYILIYSAYCEDLLKGFIEELSKSDYEYKFYKKDLRRRANNVRDMERKKYHSFYLRAAQQQAVPKQ